MGFKSLVGIPEHEDEETTTRGQARKGDRPHEGRLWECPKGSDSDKSQNAKPLCMDGARRSQTCDLMNKNRIEGRHGASRGHNTAKSSGLPVEVNAAVMQGSIVQLPGDISWASAPEKLAEAIGVGETSRGRDARLNNDTGRLTQRRAEPNGSVLTANQTAQPTTPDGEAWTRYGSLGSMWMLRTGFGPLLTRACPASDRNRRVRTRTHGGVGPVAGSC
jgi:hypothetical protein